MKSIVYCLLLMHISVACNNKETKPTNVSDKDTGSQKRPKDTTKYDIILILGEAMSNLAYDLDTMKLTEDPDIDFSKIIERHHRAGMEMSKAELDAGEDTVLKTLAQKIIKRQQKETDELNGFINSYKPQLKSGFGKRAKEMMYKPPGSGLPMHGAIMDHDFTNMMLLHHQEGVNLAKEYLKDGKAHQVRSVAIEIVELQLQEVAVLKKWNNKRSFNNQ